MSVYQERRKDGSLKSPYYQYSFRLKIQGRSKRFTGSTGQAALRDARAVEAVKRREAALGLTGSSLTVEQACDRYWREVGQHAVSKHAAETTKSVLADLILHYGADTQLLSIGPKEVNAAIESKRGTPVIKRTKLIEGRYPKPATVNRTVLEGMRRLMRRAKSHWELPIDLDRFAWGGRGGLRLKGEVERMRQLTAAEETRLWRELPADYHDIVEFLIISGKRKAVLLGLTKMQVDLERGAVRIPILKKSEGRKWDDMPLSPRELEIIKACMLSSPAGCSAVFTAPSAHPKHKGQRRPITAQMLGTTWRAALARAQIADLRIHDLRHTFASRALAAGQSLKALQIAMDHGDPRSTWRYAHLADEGAAKLGVRSSVETTRNAPSNVADLRQRKAGE